MSPDPPRAAEETAAELRPGRATHEAEIQDIHLILDISILRAIIHAMTQARKTLIDPEVTLYYHCVARCVRHAYLCGSDPFTGKTFDHRKGWIVDRLAAVAEIFTIRVCAYAVMSNHVHLVLRIDPAAAAALTREELDRRHARLFPLMHDRMQGLPTGEVKDRLELFRSRLADIGWFVRCLRESVARRANREDGCRGRFWEGRYKSQALLDEAALLTCMCYVDLNPVRAGLARSLEGWDFTSIQQRLRQGSRRGKGERGDAAKGARRRARIAGEMSSPAEVRLAGFRRESSASTRPAGPDSMRNVASATAARLPVSFGDYLALVRWACRGLLAGKPGARPPELPAASHELLSRLGLDPAHWLDAVKEFGRRFFICAGSEERIRAHGERRGLRRMRGACKARDLYSENE